MNRLLIAKIILKYKKTNLVHPQTPDRFTPSHVRGAENCGSALTHQ